MPERPSTSAASPSGAADDERQITALLHALREPVGKLARRELPSALIEGDQVVAAPECTQQTLALGGQRARHGSVCAARRGVDLDQGDGQRSRHALQILAAGAAGPRRQARAHGDHAHAHRVRYRAGRRRRFAACPGVALAMSGAGEGPPSHSRSRP